MITLDIAEQWVRWSGGAVGIVLHILLFGGLLRGQFKQVGRSVGATGWQRSLPMIALAVILYLVIFYFLWRPIPLPLSDPARIALLVAGGLLYFPGAAIMVWGRL